MKAIRIVSVLLILCLLPMGGFAAEAAPELLAWYTFDDAKDLGKDASGRGHALVRLGNVTATEGYFGQAAYFDGVSGLIATQSGMDFLDTYQGKSLTISFFAKMDLEKAHTGNQRVVDHGVNGCEDAFTTVLKKTEDEDAGTYLTFIGTAAGSDWWGASGAVAGGPGEWHRYVMTYDAKKHEVATYVDGVPLGACYADGNGVQSAYVFCIGGSYARADWFSGKHPLEGFIGAVDDVKIIGGVLPEAERIDAMTVPTTLGKPVIRVDFANHTGMPLLKRQNTFSPSHSFVGAYIAEFMRDADTLAQMRPESMRVDLFMGNGGIGATLGRGVPDKMSNSFMQMDMTLKQFYKGGAMPYVVYFATPEALFDKSAGPNNYWKYPPKDYEAWAELCGDIAAHYAGKSWPLAAHEIWNEPDWGTAFYGGSWADYLKIYEYGATGIRAKDPYATVGGMSLAEFDKYYSNGNVRKFLDHVKSKNLPLDFVSYHCYVPRNYPTYTRLANDSLSAYGDTFRTTGLHLNEFHISMDEKVTATEACVVPMMDAILFTLDNPTITSVNWACFRVSSEQGIQLIDSRSGNRLAAYHLLSFYNRMPMNRVALEEKNQIRGIAALDDTQAGVMLYNRSMNGREFVLDLDNLPYEYADITIYAIDAAHSNYGRTGGDDAAAIVYQAKDVATDAWTYYGLLPVNGLIYAEITQSGTEANLNPVATIDSRDCVIHGGIATVLRREYYFEDRSSTMFSEFDLCTFSAWAGMGNRASGTAKGSVVMENLPEQLVLRPELTKAMAKGGTAFLYVSYIDDGIVQENAVYTAGEDGETLPLDGEILLKTPEGFRGQLKLEWGLRNAGKDVTLKIDVEKE